MDKDKQVTIAKYALTQKNKNNPKIRVTISTLLLSLVQDKLQKETDYAMDLSKPLLVNYALLSLLDKEVLDKLRYELAQDKSNTRLVKLLNNKTTKDANPNGIMNAKLDKIDDKIQRNRIELDSILTALSWLISERSGILYDTMLKNGTDVYKALRNDDIKPVIDAILRAGINENDRQRHLNNL